MSRPKPDILLQKPEFNDESGTWRDEQILKADSIYAVFYDNQPINYRSVDDIHADKPNLKYKKTSHPNPGHAHNLADKLNKMFQTDKFKVYRLGPVEEVKEDN